MGKTAVAIRTNYEANNVKKIYRPTFKVVASNLFVKSPLRYPGGKSRAVKVILEYIPDNLKTLASPFLGGGSVELALASKGVKVYAYDDFKPLVLFWQSILKEPKAFADKVRKYHPLSKKKFYELQETMRTQKLKNDDLAIIFFVLNRASFSGITLSGGMSPEHPRFTHSAIERVADFKIKNLTVQQKDFRDSLQKHKQDFLYLDPPYANGEALYGERGDKHIGFDHVALAKILKNREGWVLSYNDCKLVRDLYKGFPTTTLKWQYGMSNNKASNEILILSKDLKKCIK